MLQPKLRLQPRLLLLLRRLRLRLRRLRVDWQARQASAAGYRATG